MLGGFLGQSFSYFVTVLAVEDHHFIRAMSRQFPRSLMWMVLLAVFWGVLLGFCESLSQRLPRRGYAVPYFFVGGIFFLLQGYISVVPIVFGIFPWIITVGVVRLFRSLYGSVGILLESSGMLAALLVHETIENFKYFSIHSYLFFVGIWIVALTISILQRIGSGLYANEK